MKIYILHMNYATWEYDVFVVSANSRQEAIDIVWDNVFAPRNYRYEKESLSVQEEILEVNGSNLLYSSFV